MNVRAAWACVATCAMCLLLGGAARAQWSSPTNVGIVESVASFPPGVSAGASAARCGNRVVVGFDDSESGVKNSFGGYAVSSDGGATFRDLGVLPVSTEDPGFGPDRLVGQPSLACGSSQLFYYAASFIPDRPFIAPCEQGPLCAAISVSISRDGGMTWTLPTMAAIQSGDTHSLFSPSTAVDSSSLPRIYIAYVDDNLFGPPFDYVFPECANTFEVMEVRLARSIDNGKTWTTSAIDHACGSSTNPETQGVLESPNVAISPSGKVYITYEFHQLTGTPTPGENEIRFTRSVNQGQTFSPPIVVSKDAIDNARPRLAVDRTISSFRGAIYLTWSGMPRGTTTEVLMSDSLNQGVSFSFPRAVRGTSVGTQINPVVAVDNDGQVATCYYVTGTNTPTSSSNYFYNCLTSFNHAATWASYQKLGTSAPLGLDALTSDSLLQNHGFFTAFEQSERTQRKLLGSRSDNP
jgi:hypothetical protein